MKRIKIYNSDGSTNISHLRNKIGVYKIYYRNQKKAKYVGLSTYNLYKTILRYFQAWSGGLYQGQKTVSFTDKGMKKTDFYLTYHIGTPKKTSVREKKIIKKEKPEYNTQYIDVKPDF